MTQTYLRFQYYPVITALHPNNRWYGEHGTQWQAQLQTVVFETTYAIGSFESLSQLDQLAKNLGDYFAV